MTATVQQVLSAYTDDALLALIRRRNVSPLSGVVSGDFHFKDAVMRREARRRNLL